MLRCLVVLWGMDMLIWLAERLFGGWGGCGGGELFGLRRGVCFFRFWCVWCSRFVVVSVGGGGGGGGRGLWCPCLSFGWCFCWLCRQTVAFRTFIRSVLVWICRFPLPLGVWEELRFVIVALPVLFSYLFFNDLNTNCSFTMADSI